MGGIVITRFVITSALNRLWPTMEAETSPCNREEGPMFIPDRSELASMQEQQRERWQEALRPWRRRQQHASTIEMEDHQETCGARGAWISARISRLRHQTF